MRAALIRGRSNSRLVSAELIVADSNGAEVVRAGGVWDTSLCMYVEPPKSFAHAPVISRLQVAQDPLMRGFAGWFRKAIAGDVDRVPLMLAAGNRGSSKTYALAGIVPHLVSLQWPGDESFIVVLNAENRRECLEHQSQVGPAEWIEVQSQDPRQPYTQWVTGARTNWISSRNPNRLQQGGLPIRYILLNEAHMMSEVIAAKAQYVGRNLGALMACAFNPPIADGGNWTARMWFGLESGEGVGEKYYLANKDNAAVDHHYLDAAGKNIRIISPAIAAADVDGDMKMSGPTAYGAFDGRPFNHVAPVEGGHVGRPPDIGWTDVTRELTAKDCGDRGDGADYVGGTDFQKHPGCVTDVAKIYRTPPPAKPCPLCDPEKRGIGCQVLYVVGQVTTTGMESALSQALVDSGYSTNGHLPTGERAPMILLVGDATGARQNSEHVKQRSPSFIAMRNDGWIIVPPSRHFRTRREWNPDVIQSLAQMDSLLVARHIIFGPDCKQSSNGFPSLVDSFRNAQRSRTGKLRDDGGFQHGPDGVRYLAWKYLARPKPIAPPTTGTGALVTELRSLRRSER